MQAFVTQLESTYEAHDNAIKAVLTSKQTTTYNAMLNNLRSTRNNALAK